MNLYEDFLNLSLAIIRSENSLENNMQSICDLLDNKLVNYDWIGFYMTNIENRTLHLRPYNGRLQNIRLFLMGMEFVDK